MAVDANGDMTVTTTEIGSNHWCVQAQYSPISLQAGKQYKFTYTLRSSGSGSVAAFLQRNGEPYDTFTWRTESVDTSAQSFTQTFTAKEDCDIVKIGFDCGFNTGTFYISAVSLVCLG